MINFKSNFTFHNIFIYDRATFSNRVACCVDFTRESWQPVEASCKEFCKLSFFKIHTNRKTYLTVYAKTLSTLFFKYLPNILQHSSLNGYFHEGSENKTANVFSLIFAVFDCSYSDISVNAL